MIVTVPGLSGLTKAYTSVLSATGSLEISGASRWDDMSVSSVRAARVLASRPWTAEVHGPAACAAGL